MIGCVAQHTCSWYATRRFSGSPLDVVKGGERVEHAALLAEALQSSTNVDLDKGMFNFW